MAPNSRRQKDDEASFVHTTHNRSLTSIRPLYLALFARCICTDTHFVCKKTIKFSAIGGEKKSRPGD